MELNEQQVATVLGETGKQAPPDYSVKHRNLGQYYGQLWQSSSQRLTSRILWFLLLLLFVLFISIPILQSLVSYTLAHGIS